MSQTKSPPENADRSPRGKSTSVRSPATTWLRSLSTKIVGSPQAAIAVVIVLFVLYGVTQSPSFLDVGTWINILRNAVFLVIVGSFTTLVFVSGGLDLSVGSVFAAGAVGAAMAAKAGWPIVIAFGVGFAVGALVGVINGVLVSYSGIPAFIATLGTLFAVRSIVGFVTGGSPVSPLPDGFKQVGQGEIFGLPFLIVYAAAAALIAHVILAYSYLGTNTRALGGNREAARASGIKTRLLSTGIYTLSGASAGLAGALMAARLGSGTPTLGGGFELQVIAAVIIGGTSLFGAIGSVPGTLLGALLLSVLTTGLILLGLDPVLQNLALGSILIIAVGLDQYRRHTMFRISRMTE